MVIYTHVHDYTHSCRHTWTLSHRHMRTHSSECLWACQFCTSELSFLQHKELIGHDHTQTCLLPEEKLCWAKVFLLCQICALCSQALPPQKKNKPKQQQTKQKPWTCQASAWKNWQELGEGPCFWSIAWPFVWLLVFPRLRIIQIHTLCLPFVSSFQQVSLCSHHKGQ